MTEPIHDAVRDRYARSAIAVMQTATPSSIDEDGIGASLFGCMAGQPPQPADQRELEDKVPAALDAMEHAYSRALLDLVGWCLKLDALERPQSVFALQRAMRHIEPPPDDTQRAATTVGRWIDTLAGRVPVRRRGDESVGSLG